MIRPRHLVRFLLTAEHENINFFRGINMKFVALFGILMASACFADTAPPCLDFNGNVLPQMDQTVINWKETTNNQWKSRAHVTGTVDQIFPDATGHHHFEISMGPDAQDTLEVIYNEGFGATPQIQVGDQIEACGDYVTAYSGQGASPSGALIHWIHQSDTPKHPDGYLMVNGVLYGNLGG